MNDATTAETLPAPPESTKSKARAARDLAMATGDVKLANAYYMLGDSLADAEAAFAELGRLRAEMLVMAARVENNLCGYHSPGPRETLLEDVLAFLRGGT